MAKTTHHSYVIELRGETITLTDEEADAIRASLLRQFLARSDADEAAAREAGRVWYAVFTSYGQEDQEEFFSLEEAASFLDSSEETGHLAPVSIRRPDGTTYTRADRGGSTWRALVDSLSDPRD